MKVVERVELWGDGLECLWVARTESWLALTLAAYLEQPKVVPLVQRRGNSSAEHSADRWAHSWAEMSAALWVADWGSC